MKSTKRTAAARVALFVQYSLFPSLYNFKRGFYYSAGLDLHDVHTARRKGGPRIK